MGLAYLKVFLDFDERTEDLSIEEKQRLLYAMYQYAKTGVKPEMKGNERFVFASFKVSIDNDIQAQEQKSETNRINGLKGGRPKKNQLVMSESKTNQSVIMETEKTERLFDKTEETEKRQEKEEEKEKEKEYEKEEPPKGGMGGNEISPGVVDDLSDLDEVVANVEKKKPRKQEKKNQFERVLDENGITGELRTAYLDFVDMRSKIKKPMTDRALKILIDKTKKLAEDETTQIAILHQSIEHDWQTVYELKNDTGFKRKINSTEDVKKAFGSFHSVFDDIPDDFSGTFDDTVRNTEKENAVTGEGTVA